MWCFKFVWFKTEESLPAYEKVVGVPPDYTTVTKLEPKSVVLPSTIKKMEEFKPNVKADQDVLEKTSCTPGVSKSLYLRNQIQDLQIEFDRVSREDSKVEQFYKILEAWIQYLKEEYNEHCWAVCVRKVEEFIVYPNEQQKKQLKELIKRLKIIKLEHFFKTRGPPRVRISKKYTINDLNELLNSFGSKPDRFKAICEIYDTMLEFLVENRHCRKLHKLYKAVIQKADDYATKDVELTKEQKEQFKKYKKQTEAIQKMKN